MSDHIDQSTLTDATLDHLLARSAPAVSTGSVPVQRELRALVDATAAAGSAEASARSRRGRTRRCLTLGAGAVVMAFAGVSVAAASPSAPGWLAWAGWKPDATVVNSPGQCALVGIKVVPAGAGLGDPGVVAGSRYLADLDVADIDYSRELVEQRESVITLEDGREVRGEDVRSEDELEYWAYTDAITQMVYEEVERQGISTEHVSIEGRADDCGWEAQ